ncbi:hypothetical protein B0J11DRAFT_329891 [Dendryphion nanum]|uniref:Uncharacterized protein n=1 Tax=Dendryphion nanum TaxID=256645 RepID=A0A9P9DRP6_9PLEO|nr:hypothetical protein B0J11DRAFT_329891 [Dendryphion nanum]
MASVAPRRFNVEPIETTSRSSKDLTPKVQTDSPNPPRRFSPDLVETVTKTHRQLPEPIETTHRTSCRFAPEPIVTTTYSPQKNNHKPARKFKAEPVETKTRRSRNKFAEEWDNQTTKKQEQNRPARKFAPQLIETARRSRRSGDTEPALLASDKTEATPAQSSKNLKRLRIDATPPPPENTPTADFSHNPLFAEIERATSPLTGRRPCRMRSRHSFRVPDLDPIESSESEASNPPSPVTSPSIISDHSFMYKEATRMRESVDARSSGYLLELAAKAAEKQLQEQVMAAFPNTGYHETVDHFIDHDSDDADSFVEPQSGRRESPFTMVNWELVAMRRHREAQDQNQEDETDPKEQPGDEKNSSDANKPHNAWVNAAAMAVTKDPELDRMRKDARPPMLGKDIKFPRCPSPEPARFDTTQGCDAVRISMCYLAEQSQAAERGEGLWCGESTRCVASNPPSLYSNASSRSPSHGNSGGGLWGGSCITTGLTPPRGPTGILTPRIDVNSLLSPCPTPQMSLLPPTPPASQADFACIDEKLAAEVAIEEDFGDDFVTQVYNYLSLGYPSLARMFDEELSTISKIPVSELRQDDHLLSSRGYIRLGADGNLTDASITEETCMRWRALRVYVREWARQHPGMAIDGSLGVGTAVRKGSWAV